MTKLNTFLFVLANENFLVRLDYSKQMVEIKPYSSQKFGPKSFISKISKKIIFLMIFITILF